MVRVKRGVTKRRRRKKLIKMAKGYMWGRKKKYRLAKEALLHALTYAFRDRKTKKREFRKLWQIKIGAASRLYGDINYSRFMGLLRKKGISLDRKILASLAQEKPEIFQEIVNEVKS